jgi:hypothetical protein
MSEAGVCFAATTPADSGEVRGAQWTEIYSMIVPKPALIAVAWSSRYSPA